jgi:hypothetical protein
LIISLHQESVLGPYFGFSGEGWGFWAVPVCALPFSSSSSLPSAFPYLPLSSNSFSDISIGLGSETEVAFGSSYFFLSASPLAGLLARSLFSQNCFGLLNLDFSLCNSVFLTYAYFDNILSPSVYSLLTASGYFLWNLSMSRILNWMVFYNRICFSSILSRPSYSKLSGEFFKS